MASAYSRSVQAMIDALSRLPSVGPKSAQRIAFHLLKLDREEVARLTRAIDEARSSVQFCERCFNFSEAAVLQYHEQRGVTPASARDINVIRWMISTSQTFPVLLNQPVNSAVSKSLVASNTVPLSIYLFVCAETCVVVCV